MVKFVKRISKIGFKEYVSHKRIVCIGIGQMFCEAIDSLGIADKIEMLIDNSREKQEKGIDFSGRHWDIYPLNTLNGLDFSETIILFTTKYLDEIYPDIDRMDIGWEINAFTYQDILLSESLTNRSLERQKQIFIQKYGDSIEEADARIIDLKKRISMRDDYTVIPKINVIVTERCSLRCKDCRALIPYVRSASDEPIDKVKSEISAIIDAVDEIIDIEPIGGEPFLYPDLPELLGFLCGNEKVDNVCLTTNGTILPGPQLTEALKHPKIFIVISDYGHIDKMALLVSYLEKHRIAFSTEVNQVWFDVGGFEYRGRNQAGLEREYRNCYCQYLVKYVWDNRLWLCPRAPRLSSLGVFEDRHDFIDLQEVGGREELRTKIVAGFYETYAEACNYCNQGDFDIKSIPAGIQLNGGMASSDYTLIKRSEYEELRRAQAGYCLEHRI